jgi:Tfp pilus assembly protein PilZ
VEHGHEIEGRVVWVRTPAESGPHAPGMGVEFTDRTASARLARDLDALD